MTNPTQSETLLPCPFCGTTPACYAHPEHDDNEHWVVTCQRCDIMPDDCWCKPKAEVIKVWNTRLQSIPEPLLDEGLVSVRIDPATAQTLMDWNVLHTTDAGWVIDLDIWRSALSIPRLEAGRVTEECATCDGKGVYDSFDGDGRAFEFECYICHGTGRAMSSASAPDGPALTELEEKSK